MAVILVVDDSLSVRQSIRMILEKDQHEVYEAENGEEGLAILRRYKNSIELLMVDVHMPVMNGLVMIKTITVDAKGLYPDIPIVVVTTEDDPGLTGLAKMSGIKGWCLKPLTAAQTRFVLEKALG